MDRLAIFLIKRRLGVKEGQKFYFKNQKDKQDRYAFVGNKIVKYCSNIAQILLKWQQKKFINILELDCIK